MITEPPPNPAYDDAERAAVRRHNVELLTGLNDAAAAWAIDLLKATPADPAEAARTGATFERVFRAIRRTVLLIEKLIDPGREPAAASPPRPPGRRARDPDDDDDAADHGAKPATDRIDALDRADRLESVLDEIDRSFDTLGEAELIARLCDGVGLQPIDEAGQPRTLPQLNAIYRKALADAEAALLADAEAALRADAEAALPAAAAQTEPPDTS